MQIHQNQTASRISKIAHLANYSVRKKT